jgi:hypothetical protein
MYYPGGHIEENRSRVEGGTHSLIAPSGSTYRIAENLYHTFVNKTSLVYGQVMRVRVEDENTYFFYSDFGSVKLASI